MQGFIHKTFLWIVLVIVVLALGVLAYQFGSGQREHLIQGVPYWGIYEGTEMNSSQAFAVYTVLTYWGDDRFTTLDIARIFPSELSAGGETAVGDFLRDNGYIVENIISDDPNVLSDHIDDDIPVIVPLRLTPTDTTNVSTYRVVIGYSNKNEEFIVHDNLYGNNLKIPFGTYRNMRANMGQILVVKPGESIESDLRGPDKSYEYPQRTSAMDSESTKRIVTNWFHINALAEEYAKTGNPTGNYMALLGEELLAEEDFSKLHPAARVQISFFIARLYSRTLDNHERAKEILLETTLPLLNTDFSQPFGDWKRRITPEVYATPMWTSQPWVLFGLVNERLGDFDAAREAYTKAVEANPNDTDAKNRLNNLSIE